MNKELPSESALISDLRATFPGMHIRPLREFGSDWRNRVGVWTGGTGDSDGCMPDGLAIFNTLAYGEEEYDGPIHTGFLIWLELRGWYIESYDAATHHIVAIAECEECLEKWMLEHRAAFADRVPLDPGECPF